MKLCVNNSNAIKPFTPPTTSAGNNFKQQQVSIQCSSLTRQLSFKSRHSLQSHSLKNWEAFFDPVSEGQERGRIPLDSPIRLGDRWMEYQGARNWDGLLDPLDDNLRSEILRYGNFVEAAYQAFDFNPSSPGYGTCRFRRKDFFRELGYLCRGYRITTNLRATSGIQMPRWTDKAPSWMAMQSSWIGYVAVCQDKEAIARLGRRDVVIAFRGTATCLEWLENLRATLSHLPGHPQCDVDGSGPMVESGVKKLSFTITGHSLGAALATLTAYDIKKTFEHAPLVTVISFGGPRVGNRSFRSEIEKQGTKILRIVNPDDPITKVPGFIVHNDDNNIRSEVQAVAVGGWPSWLQKRVPDAQWAYAEVGCELRLESSPSTEESSPYLINNINVARCHDLKTYLQLVESSVGSKYCPLRATARRLLRRNRERIIAQWSTATAFLLTFLVFSEKVV
ncbi:Dolichyl-diphosphooligosaccharide-protein glycosyltransferase subunit dad1 [Ancistrocladus abbreviatus]